tara:strand:- start:1199 stop:1387 length:189 start_codon:yes stop_codon:yes gene_type:complete
MEILEQSIGGDTLAQKIDCTTCDWIYRKKELASAAENGEELLPRIRSIEADHLQHFHYGGNK